MQKFIVSAALAFTLGCASEKAETKVTIPLDQVPENVMKVAKKELPDVKFDMAMKKQNGDFEVRGKDKNGKIREIDVKPDGTIVEIE